MKNFSIETIIDGYLIMGSIREKGTHGKIVRPTLEDTKNFIFNIMGSDVIAKDLAGPDPDPEKPRKYTVVSFSVEELSNGFILAKPKLGEGGEEKTYVATAKKLVEEINTLINENIQPEPY